MSVDEYFAFDNILLRSFKDKDTDELVLLVNEAYLYQDQIHWAKVELNNVKKILEDNTKLPT